MEQYQERAAEEKSKATDKAMGKKNDLSAFGRFERFINDILDKQIRLFRFLFGTIPASIGIEVFMQIRNEQPIPIEALWIKLLVWVIFGFGFIATYKIEHWDVKRASANDERKKTVEKKFEYIDQLQNYTLQQWIPDIDDADTKIEVFKSLGKLVNLINVADIKDDMAQLHSSLAESLNLFLNSFAQMKKELQKEMYKLLPKQNQKRPQDMARDELEDMMDKQLDGIDAPGESEELEVSNKN
ncbi:MAG: hypothetical protein GWN00_28515 [Aliifodinibius sp.]|nr:hypothetical protein [Fodinibius sp.]NIY28602.1 hypothetical protein [Fodinibius sp.]